MMVLSATAELWHNLKRMLPNERRRYFLNHYREDAANLRMCGAPKWMIRWADRQVERIIAQMEAYDATVLGGATPKAPNGDLGH